MIVSMTGYGGHVYQGENFTLETELKSLNSRFLDLSVRLPKELYSYEFIIRDIVKNKIGRGKVSLSINLISPSAIEQNKSLDLEALSRTVDLLNKIKTESNVKEDITIGNVLLLKENFLNENKNDLEISEEIIKQTVNNALDNLVEMKKKEGVELKKDLDLRIQKISDFLAEIEKLSNSATQEYFNKFKERASKLTEEFVDDKDRFLIELGILSEKHDVTEECTRLHSHIKMFTNTANTSSDSGRKLNFICQEMNREVNTINSKSISSEISHLGIYIKEELEKIREQVQNIE